MAIPMANLLNPFRATDMSVNVCVDFSGPVANYHYAYFFIQLL